jgi:propanol-preferring alcohol dehydrogenase
MSLPKTMRAAVVHELGKPLSIEEVPVPEPGDNEVLVKIVASGVCHTDIHAAEGDWPVKPKLPLIPGHEGVGYVAAVGRGVRHLKEGDKVGIPWLHDACGCCEHCITGWETLCPDQHNTGYGVDGGYAEYAIASAPYAGRLPEDADFVKFAPILCAGVTTYKGLLETEVRPGEWVVVSGVGGLGHVGVQYARAMGMHVVAVDIDDAKLELARRLGAEVTVNAATDPDAAAAVRKATGGGAHGALVTAVSRPAFAQSLNMLRAGGTASLVGLPPGDFPLPIFDVVLKRLTVRGSIVGTRKDLQECIDIAADGLVNPITETQPLEAINDVFARLKSGAFSGRIVLDIANGG